MKLARLVCSALLATGVVLVAWVALPGSARAATHCPAVGHSCHILIGGTVLHREVSPPAY